MVRGPPNCAPVLVPFSSEICNKMRDELTGLLEIFHKIEEAGGNTPLSLSPPPWEWPRPSLRLCRPPGSTASTASSSPPAPGNQAAGRRRRRNRGAAARARRNQQAATSQVTLAEVVPPPRLPPTPPCRPLRHLLSPTPTSGRRRVMSLGGRRCPPSPPSTWTDAPLLLLLHHLPHHHLHGYAMTTARTTSTAATAESVLSFVMITLAVTAMDGEEGLGISFHCAVCCCGRCLEHQNCKLKDLLSPEAYHTASHPYHLWHFSCDFHYQ